MTNRLSENSPNRSRRGRPGKFSKYEQLVQNLTVGGAKRAKYVGGIGFLKGARGTTVYVKIRFPHGGIFRGKRIGVGQAHEIKVGNLASWSFQQLEDEIRRLQGLADRNEPLEAAATPIFSEWASEWLDRAEPRLRSFQTIRAHVNLSLNPMFGSMELRLISTSNVNAWIKKRLGDAMPATVKREQSTLTTILNDAIKSGLLETNPCANADRIKGVVGRQRFLKPEEMVVLLVKAEKVAKWLPDFILWCVHSGMRKSEVLGIQWSDVAKFENGRTIVTLEKTKSDQPRQIICTDTMVEILGRQKKRKVPKNNSVFPVSKMTLRRRWEKARKAADISDVTMHDLRRTNATYAAAAGVDLKTLADRLGHTNLTMLEKRYAALVGTAQVAAAETIEGVFDAITG
jgi:integrase